MRSIRLTKCRSLILPVLVLCGLGISALTGCTQSRAEEKRVLSATAVPGESLRITTDNGGVTVSIEPGRTDVGISATVYATASSYEEAVRRLDDISIIVDHAEGPVLDVSVDYGPDGRRSGDGCAIDVRMPAVAGVFVMTRNGRIELTGTRGAAELKTSNGRITVNGHDGSVNASTSNGTITAQEISGPVKLDTSNGRITYVATAEVSEPFDLETSNGSVTVRIPRTIGGRISAKTSNGAITIKGELPAGAIHGSSKDRTIDLGDDHSGDGTVQRSRIRTSNGHITIEVFDRSN